MSFLTLIPIATAATTVTTVGEVETFGDFISQIWTWAFGVILALSVLMLVVGGLVYMSGGGDETRLEKARQTVNGSLIAISITMLSAVIRQWLLRPAEELGGGELKLSDTARLIQNTTNVLLGIVGGIAIIMLVLSAYRYFTAHGRDEEIAKAKRSVRWVVIGLMIALTAYFLVGVIVNVWQI